MYSSSLTSISVNKILCNECFSEISERVTFNVDCCQIVYVICDFYRGVGKVGNKRK